MSKGSNRRPMKVSEKEFSSRWDILFRKDNSIPEKDKKTAKEYNERLQKETTGKQ
jgi:hypothetical protein